jgi:hypothetical protein
MPPTIVHFSSDTLPRVVVGPAGTSTLQLLLPFRIDVGGPGVTVRTWQLQVQVDDASWDQRVRTGRLHRGLAAELRGRMDRSGAFSFTHLPYYAALDDAGIAEGRVVYLEGRVPDVPEGARVSYTLTVTGRDNGVPFTVTGPTYRTRAVDPRFTRAEVARTVMPDPRGAPDAYVLMHRRAGGLDRIRVDVLDLGAEGAPERARLAIDVDGRTVLDLPALPRTPAPGDLVDIPLVDLAADSVTVAVPYSEGAPEPTVTVRYRDHRDDPQQDTHDLGVTAPTGTARVVFVNFAIQGLNDLFAGPDDAYTPPRTYTQLTMRDETANYSSRPGIPENGDGDGYAFTIEAHRRFRVPQMWAMNGGLLGLLAHDRPADLEAMSDDVKAGWLVPVVAGYGAHRLPYYKKPTNLDAMTFGSQALANMLGHTRPVYYPDSRITVDEPEITEALAEADVRFLVVDAPDPQLGSDRSNLRVDQVDPPMGRVDPATGRYLDWQYLWRDRRSGADVLFIDGQTKDKLLTSTPAEADRGTLHHDLRSMLIDFASRPVVRAGNLVVYSDDADKASGNGWFDGGSGNNQRYQAALWWVATHPWVQAVTTDQLGPADRVGDLDLLRASDPYIEKNWTLDVALDPDHVHGLVYDRWYAVWARTRAAWLGENLRAISDRAEAAIAWRRGQYAPGDDEKDELLTLARLHLVMCLHESQWSKRPRIDPPDGKPPRADDPAAQPEDFVVAESLQLRNLHVLLGASIWGQWAAAVARGDQPPGAHRDDGPVVDAVAAFEQELIDAEAAAGATPPTWRQTGRPGLQWDHDPLPNVVLYNEQALVVLDRNGGRITHLFVLVGGRPVAVSGTYKAYQSLDLDWASDAGSQCDGLVLQNTVATPNHAYVAGDIDASGTTGGESPTPGEVYGWAYPDNFNAYVEQACDQAEGPAVAFTYGDTVPAGATAPTTIAALEQALADDLAAKVAGQPGLVLHDIARFGDFGKTVRLDGRTVHVTYRGTRPGHRVANELCVDVLASALHGCRQAPAVAADGRSATVTNQAGLTVGVQLDPGCVFTDAVGAPLDPPTVESLRLHRVMTDNLKIVAPDGGDFAYRILLP